jgi:hypothetical protein
MRENLGSRHGSSRRRLSLRLLTSYRVSRRMLLSAGRMSELELKAERGQAREPVRVLHGEDGCVAA